MVKKNTWNNDFLKDAKEKTSTKIYSLVVKLVHSDREDLAKMVLKVNSFLEYASVCIKQRDHNEAKESLDKAKNTIDLLEKEEVDTEYLDYLYQGILKKCKK